MNRLYVAVLVGMICGALGWSAPLVQNWTLVNPGGDYTDECFRLPVTLKTPYDASTLSVMEDGKPVAFQVEVHGGTRKAVTDGAVWVCTTVAAHGKHDYVVTQPDPTTPVDPGDAAATPPDIEPKVQVSIDGDDYVLDNGLIAVRVPAQMTDLNGPIAGIKASTGAAWMGGSVWTTNLKLAKFTSSLLGDGTLFAKVKLHYQFTPTADLAASFADVTLRLAPGQPFVSIEEAHSMAPTDGWTLNMDTSWKPNTGWVRGWYFWDPNPYQPPALPGGIKLPVQPPGSRSDEKLHQLPIAISARGYTPDTMMTLLPRWTTLVDNGWFYSVSDGVQLVGVAVVRAGKWDWPADNKISITTDPATTGSVAAVLPTSRGRRYFYLMAGPRALADTVGTTVVNAAVQPLDKLVNEYLMDWPDAPAPPATYDKSAWDYTPLSPFDGTTANPTRTMRISGTNLLATMRLGAPPTGGMNLLGNVNAYLDPDFFPGYWNHWSPLQPDYMDDALRLPLVECAALKSTPHFKDLSQRVSDAFTADVSGAVTLPGGAGMGSPGQLLRNLKSWFGLLPTAGQPIMKGQTYGMVDVARKYLGFDPLTWPRIKAAVSFLNKTSVPFSGTLTDRTGATGTGRRMLPAGDTPYPGLSSSEGNIYYGTIGQDDFAALMNIAGVKEDITQYTSEELPGFGAVLRDAPGTSKESFLAFEAGPNRFGMMGDALNFIYCTTGKRLAIEHMSSGSYREDQEHMHNRVAFMLPTTAAPDPNNPPKYYNMDGYPRLIAFATTKTLDVAVGQVESTRLREVAQKPTLLGLPAARPVFQPLDKPLTYRRTILLVKGLVGGDAVVIRDQVWGQVLKAIFCLQHPTTLNCSRMGGVFDLGNARLLVLAPKDFTYERLDWSSGMMGFTEQTDGIRVCQTGTNMEFLTVLTPSPGIGASLTGNVVTVSDGKVSDAITLADPGDDKTAAVVSHTRGTTNETLLTGADVDLNRSQGDITLYAPETDDLLGPVPDWLQAQRKSPVADSTWNW